MQRIARSRSMLVALAVLLPALAGVMPAAAANQKTFATAEEAVEALLATLEDGDLDAMMELFGSEHRDALIGPDVFATKEDQRRLAEMAREMNRLRRHDEGRAMLIVGREAWPFPMPLVKEEGRWLFDTEAGLEEMLNRRVGRNELSAIEVLRAYVDAQTFYASEDRDGDEVLEYAQRIISSPGMRDGLYWESKGKDDLSPFGPLVAEARETYEGAEQGDPYYGYYFRVLKKQGPNPPGGAYDYVINGNMIAGFALLAYPAEYGNSGIMTFLVSHQGKVYEHDFGEDTAARAGRIKTYDPDSKWGLVED